MIISYFSIIIVTMDTLLKLHPLLSGRVLPVTIAVLGLVHIVGKSRLVPMVTVQWNLREPSNARYVRLQACPTGNPLNQNTASFRTYDNLTTEDIGNIMTKLLF